MSVKISRLTYKLLWNSEYTIFVTQLAAIIQKYKPDALHLTKAFGKVTALLPDILKIKAQELSNEISNQLQKLDAERDAIITAIPAQVKAIGRMSSMASLTPHVVVLNHFFDTEGRDIATDNYNSETKRIIDLLADYDAKPDVQAAAAALNQSIFFEQLRVVNTQFNSLFMKRTEEDAAIEKVDTSAIRAETNEALTDFFNAVEYSSSEYDQLDYAPLARELNAHIAYYKTQLKARATRRNAGKDVSEEKPIE